MTRTMTMTMTMPPSVPIELAQRERKKGSREEKLSFGSRENRIEENTVPEIGQA